MEVDGEKSVLAPAGTQNSVSLALHPLLLMNISEHWTRARAQNAGQPVQVLGAVLGQQKGRELELTNSFEVPFSVPEGGGPVTINKDFARIRESQYKEVFPDTDLLGWYTTGDGSATAADVHVQRQFAELMESPPVLVKLAPGARSSDALPVTAFESLVDVRGDAAEPAALQFLPVPYTLATEEAERIGVDHVARITSASSAPVSSATKTLMNQYGAVKMLGERLRLLLLWLEAVKAGSLSVDHDIIRDIAALTHRLPVLASDEFRKEYQCQVNDITLLTYLGALTKAYGNLNQLVTKLNVMHDRHGAGTFRRVRGMQL